MQLAHDLGQTEAFLAIRNRLLRLYDPVPYDSLSDPVQQLVATILGGQTQQARRAFARLQSRHGMTQLAQADPKAVEALIADVDGAAGKAEDIVFALRRLKAISGAVSLEFLRDWSTADALRYLESLNGLGRDVAAAVVNFSRLRKPAFVCDATVLRVLRRLGFLPPHVKAAASAYELLMPALADWPAADLFELHWLLKQLGQDICEVLRTRCRDCPLQTLCRKHGVKTFH